jgi:hypothetical protein
MIRLPGMEIHALAVDLPDASGRGVQTVIPRASACLHFSGRKISAGEGVKAPG